MSWTVYLSTCISSYKEVLLSNPLSQKISKVASQAFEFLRSGFSYIASFFNYGNNWKLFATTPSDLLKDAPEQKPEDPPVIDQKEATTETILQDAEQRLFRALSYGETEQTKLKNLFSQLEIITQLNVTGLLKLKGMEKDLNHIHPFAFLMEMKRSECGYFRIPTSFSMSVSSGLLSKRHKNLLEGISKGMERHQANLWNHLPNFCTYFCKDPSQVELFIQNKNWQKLLDYLFIDRRS